MSEQPSFNITQGKLAFFLSVCSVAGLIYAGVYAITETKFRIASLEREQKTILQSQDRFTQELGRLSDAVTALTITLKEVQIIQKVNK